MARSSKRKDGGARRRLGKLRPQHKFFLNPYKDVRFATSCPGCSGKTKQRKLPLAIHADGWGMVMLNKTCRFCPYCDLLIAHRDEIEAQLRTLFEQIAPHVIGNDYLAMGTIERKDWRRGMTKPLSVDEMRQALHDFTDHLQFEPAPSWAYAGPWDPQSKPR